MVLIIKVYVMGKIKILMLVVVSLLLTNSCYDDEGVTSVESGAKIAKQKGVTLKFGRYFGKCQGNLCVEIFMLQENKLREDISDTYPLSNQFYKGVFVPVKGVSNISTEELLLEFPIKLLETKATYNRIGMPDAGDWGGIYVEYEDYEHHKQFLIDLNTNNIPKYLKSYVYLIDEKINEIGDVNNQN